MGSAWTRFTCAFLNTETLPIQSSGPCHPLTTNTPLAEQQPNFLLSRRLQRIAVHRRPEARWNSRRVPGAHLGISQESVSRIPRTPARALRMPAPLFNKHFLHLLRLPTKMPELKLTRKAPLSKGKVIPACHGLSSQSLQHSLNLRLFFKAAI